MADDDEREDPAPKSGQLMPPGPPLPLAARTGQQRTVDWLLSRLSRWPFKNRAYIQSLKTAQEVIGERTKLGETIIGHAKTRAKLNDLGTIIAQDKSQRQREFLEEQRQMSAVLNEAMLDGEMVDERNKVEKMKLEKEKARLQKDIDALKTATAATTGTTEEEDGPLARAHRSQRGCSSRAPRGAQAFRLGKEVTLLD
jgi:hypothetical protein